MLLLNICGTVIGLLLFMLTYPHKDTGSVLPIFPFTFIGGFLFGNCGIALIFRLLQ